MSSSSACAVVEEALAKRDEGEELDIQSKRQIEQHLRTCDSCRSVCAVEDLVAFDGSSEPAHDIDDLTRQRCINTLVDAHQEETKRTLLRGNFVAKLWRRGLVVGLAACAVALLVVFFSMRAPEQSSQSPTQRPRVAKTQLRPTVILVAGETPRWTTGERIAVGQIMQSGKGVIAASLTPSVQTVLAQRAEAVIERATNERVTVALHKGCLWATVRPNSDGPALSVITPDGTVEITGTVFSLCIGDGTTSLRVLRGEVKLYDGHHVQQTIGGNSGCRLKEPGIYALSQNEYSALKETASVLDLLTNKDNARLTVENEPTAARVFLDATPLGDTPVTALVHPGEHKLEVRVGEERVTETVTLRSGEVAHRRFELGGEPPAEVRRRTVPSKSVLPDNEPDNPVTPSSLLTIAHTARVERDWAAAAKAYEELIDRFPHSGDAAVAYVSLADIELQHLSDFEAALAAYSTYLQLQPSGPLAQEASYGRVRCLRALRRPQAEKEAIEDFLQRYPFAIVAPLARDRLNELTPKEDE